ncbi:hypothetical protein ANCCAN_21260 [Ancylostoma caninum]|uniref:Uncharacterized protein n=1 Tax=Ancylostoma caninum TaxID=29170 RepID=A0A368FLK0_ANCCA|nr:hypothetical protein ANCCAN_21260 [Ancylostoma caninum]
MDSEKRNRSTAETEVMEKMKGLEATPIICAKTTRFEFFLRLRDIPSGML